MLVTFSKVLIMFSIGSLPFLHKTGNESLPADHYTGNTFSGVWNLQLVS